MPASPTGIATIDQVAVVVRDLDAAMERYWTQHGIGPWDVYTYGPQRLSEMTFCGERRPYAMKFALAFVGDTMYELIESVEGPNIYDEHIAAQGEGLHHLGYHVPDIDAAIAAMAERGCDLLQSGRGFGVGGDGAYAYFDTARELGCIMEAIQRPRQMPPPERMCPPRP